MGEGSSSLVAEAGDFCISLLAGPDVGRCGVGVGGLPAEEWAVWGSHPVRCSALTGEADCTGSRWGCVRLLRPPRGDPHRSRHRAPLPHQWETLLFPRGQQTRGCGCELRLPGPCGGYFLASPSPRTLRGLALVRSASGQGAGGHCTVLWPRSGGGALTGPCW